jgi:hypothetical protein
MQFEDSAVPPSEGLRTEGSMSPIDKATLIPALVCAVLCVILMRTGFLSLFFLVPLGLCAVVYGPISAWLGFVIAMLGNGTLLAVLSLRYGTGLAGAGMDTLYFSALSLGFTWIMAGSPSPLIPPVRTVFRFIAASLIGALAFWGMLFSLSGNEGFSALIRSQIEAISSSYIAASGGDAVQQAFLERLFTPDRIIKTFSMIVFRGGAVFSAFFLFFFSRQGAFILSRLFLRRTQTGLKRSAGVDLIGFYAPRKTIWVLSLCLPVILLCRISSLERIETAVWNILVICAIMFLAQGGGIVLFNIARRPMPAFMRLFCALAFVFVIFSPGINVMAMGFLVLLGIAETWLNLRKKVEEEVGS